MWSVSTKRQEARAWGVPFLPFDVNRSGVHFRCERDAAGVKAVRPPLNAVVGVSQDVARELLLERLKHGPYRGIDDAHQRLTLEREVFEALIRAGAFDAVQPRREALFRVGALANGQEGGVATLFSAVPELPALPTLSTEERFVWDYQAAHFSTLDMHALDLLRDQLKELNSVPLLRVGKLPRKTRVRTAGLVVSRQRPGTAKGFAFFVIEDGPIRGQVIISPDLWDTHRALIRDASVLVVDAILEDTGYQLTLKALSLYSLPAPVLVRGYHYG